MDNRRNFRRPEDNAYTPNQIEATLAAIGVVVDSETSNDFICYCPYHNNNHTPSFSIGRQNGVFLCFNPSCAITGNIVNLIKFKTGKNEFAARRLLIKNEKQSAANFQRGLNSILEKSPDFVEFKVDFSNMHNALLSSPVAHDYMINRGFTDETLDHFTVGYSRKQDMIVVPMHDPKGMPIGLIGRSVEGKRFKNSANLPKNQTLWNLHRAKRHGDTIIICEASFDAMRIHQAGFPNVVAALGGNFSERQIELINRHFDTVIIMTDYDDKQLHINKNCARCRSQNLSVCLGHNPGRDLGNKIANSLYQKRIMWASYEYGMIYPHDAKDAGDLTDEEISQCVKNAMTNFEYRSLDFD